MVGLVAIVIISALVFGGWLAIRSADSERNLLELNAESKARQVVVDIEHEVNSEIAMLTALASSHFLQNDDFEAFHRQATDVARQLDIQILLADAASGKQLVNVSVPWGQTLPDDVPQQSIDAMKETIRTGTPAVSNLFFGPVAQKFLVSVGIPISRNGMVLYYLAVGIPTDIFADALRNAAVPSQWTVALIDRDNIVIARSERHNEVVGTKIRTNIATLAETQEGTGHSVDRFGVDSRWNWQRSERTGWFVLVAVPLSVLEAPRKAALTAYAAVGGPLFVVAMALSFYMGGRISQSIGEMGIDREPTREEFRTLFEHAPNGELVVDHNNQIVMANARIEQYFGYLRDELIGRPVETLVPERLHNGELALLSNASRSSSSASKGGGRELRGRRKDGSQIPIEVALNPIATHNGSFVMVTVIDISERLLSEQRLTAAIDERDRLRRRFIQAQEGERLRLARELHDETGQNLAAIMMEMKGIDSLLDDAGRARLRTLRKQLEQMGQSLHHVAKELRPASIDELGLASALGNYVSEWSDKFGIAADFHCGDPRIEELPDETRTAIYRVIQEGLTNVAKHAKDASFASIVLDRVDGVLQLTIEDDGSGFDASSPIDLSERNDGGLGLAGMRERLSLIGGDVVIESSAETGTTIFARIPLQQRKLAL